jgi:hypothetical protein
MNKSKHIIILFTILFFVLIASFLFFFSKHQSSVQNEIYREKQQQMIDSISLAAFKYANMFADSGMVDSAITTLKKTCKMIHDSGYTTHYRDSMSTLFSVLYGDNEKYNAFVNSGRYKDVLIRLGDHNLELLYQNKYDYKLCRTTGLNAKANKLLYDNRNNIYTFKKMRSDRNKLNKIICSAALSSLLGYDKLFKYQSSYSEKLDSIFVYRSPIKKTDLYKCRVNGNRIIWGIEKANGFDSGTWMFSGVKLYYSTDGDVLTIFIMKSDVSKNETKYSIKRLKELSKKNIFQ